jgi:aquaporin Z
MSNLDQFRTKFGKALMELIGTALLVFTIQIVSAAGKSLLLAPVAIGGTLMMIVYAGGPISGGHYNPAVSLAVQLRGNMSWGEMILYWLYQLVGAYLGAVLGGIVAGGGGAAWTVVTAGTGVSLTRAYLAELIVTFTLCLVMLCVTTHGGARDNSYYGAAIGLVVLVGGITVGPISGGAFNPAVVLGLAVAKSLHLTWYAIGVVLTNLLGGILAAMAFYMVAGPEEFTSTTSMNNHHHRGIGETTPLVGV